MVDYIDFYYNTIDNKDLRDYGIFIPNGDKLERDGFNAFIDMLKEKTDGLYDWADYGLSEKIIFTTPKELIGKKFFNTILKEYVVFSPDNQNHWGGYSLDNVVYTADYCDKVENDFQHIEKLLAENDDDY